MIRQKLFALICFLVFPFSLGSCNKSARKMTDYYNDYYTHWAYDENANEILKGEHTCGEDHKCTVCGFVDPIYQINEDGVLVGLTKHGKSLINLELPNNICFISDNALDGSQVKSIKISSSVIGMGKVAHEQISKLDCKFDKSVDYEEQDDGYYQTGFFGDLHACAIGDKKYDTLDDALDAVNYNNTTIYLLGPEHIITKEHKIALETRITCFPYRLKNGATIDANKDFTIPVSGILEFGSNITYNGHINLEIKKVNEYYSSGAVAFQGLQSAPEHLLVRYTGEFITTDNKYVRGAKQTRNKLLIFPIDYYAYGALEFSEDFKTVTGLSNFGATCTNLTITAPIEGVDAVIQTQGLTQEYRKYLHIFREIINVTVFVVDGIFQNLTIENGITLVGPGAFKSFMSTNFTEGVTKLCYLLFSHIKSVTFGSDCKIIENNAFGWNKKLTSVNGGKDLVEIHRDAFTNCSELKSVNLSAASKIEFIDLSFPGCNMLCRFVLPKSNGWSFNDRKYMYEDLAPDIVAKYVLSNKYVLRRNGVDDFNTYIIYNPKEVDEYGLPNKVRPYASLPDALYNANSGDYIRILDPDHDLGQWTFDVKNKVTLDGTKSVSYKVVLRCTFRLLPGASIEFTNRVDFKGTIIHS